MWQVSQCWNPSVDNQSIQDSLSGQSILESPLWTDIQDRISLCGQLVTLGIPLWTDVNIGVRQYRIPLCGKLVNVGFPLWTGGQYRISIVDSESKKAYLCAQTFNIGFPMWRVSHYRNHLRTDIQYRISFVESESLQETLCGQTFNTGFPLWRVNHYRKPFVDRHSMQDSPLWTVSQCWIPFDSQSIQESLCGQTFNKGFPLVESLSMLDS